MSFIVVPLFPRLVSIQQKAFEPNKTLSLVEKLYKKDTEGRVVSNQGGWQKELGQDEEEIIKSLKPVFDCVQKFFEEHIQLAPNLKVYANSLWANINPTHCFNWDHTHSDCFYSGVVYLKTPPNSGKISFLDYPFFNDSFFAEETKSIWKLYGQYFFQPKEGDLFLFPSSLVHRVYPNESKENRISIAFNLTAEFN